MPLFGKTQPYRPLPTDSTLPPGSSSTFRSEDDLELELAERHVQRLESDPNPAPDSTSSASYPPPTSRQGASRRSQTRSHSLQTTCLGVRHFTARLVSRLPARTRSLSCLALLVVLIGTILLLAAAVFRSGVYSASGRFSSASASSSSSSSSFCIPLSLQRLSPTIHNKWSCYSSNSSTTPNSDAEIDTDMSDTTHSTSTAAAGSGGKPHYAHLGRLAGWLQAQKDAFLGDLKSGNGKGWVVVMGNEAGDLDTISSSIGYAALSSILQADRMVPLMLTPSSMMGLRPENLLALKNAQVPLSTLLHAESLPVATSELASLGCRFALVDHNRLLPQFGSITPGVVQGVIDHHDDEREHLDADVRVIAKTGSCSSLVVTHFQPAWQASLAGPAGDAGSPVPNEVATLLISAGLIDTHGFSNKVGSKAIDQDYQAAAFTFPLSPWYTPSTSAQSVSSSFIPPVLHEQGKELNVIKHNVSFLSSHDLLLRDYKEYNLPTASTAFPVLRVGLSTVPLGLKDWLSKGEDGWAGLMADVDKYMLEHNLDIEGVLTTFKNKRGHKKREVLLIVRIGGALDNAAAERAIRQIGAGMEADQILTLVPWEKKGWKRFLQKRSKRQQLDGKRRYGRVWEQANAEATRKVVAPLVRDLVAKFK